MKKITLAILACSVLLAGCATMPDPVAKDVQAALKKDEHVGKFDIKSTSADGNVTLEGKVDNDFQIYQAGAVAKGVKGVKKVDNKVKLN